jgi:hypothetical protein
LKRAIKLRTQFAPASDVEGGNMAVEAQPDRIPGMAFRFPVTTIVLQLIVVLHLLEPLPHLADELVVLHELLVNGQ